MNFSRKSALYTGIWIVFICNAILVVLLHLLLLNPGVDAGLHMYGSYLITRGHLPYRDLWNNKPPLIYLIGTVGFLLKSNPFLGIRVFELLIFFADLILVNKIVRRGGIGRPIYYLITFSALYLLCWDQGFLTETFVIPLNLLAIFLFLNKTRGFEWIGGWLLVLAFLLRQNAVTIIGGIFLLDILTQYRPGIWWVKLIKWFAGVLLCSLLTFVILKMLGIWEDFTDQVFVYNYTHALRVPFARLVKDHLFHNSFLSVRGVSLIMIFNVFILIALWRYREKWMKKESLTSANYFILSSILIYLVSYSFVYLSGKSYPHYFMLLLVPSVFIIGDIAQRRTIGIIVLVLMCTWAWIINIPSFSSGRKIELCQREAVSYVRDHSSERQYIHVAGFGNQYLYVMAGRFSNSPFVLPLFESDGYSNEYKNVILKNFSVHPPQFFLLNKNSYRTLDSSNFYTQVVFQTLRNYKPVFENAMFSVLQHP